MIPWQRQCVKKELDFNIMAVSNKKAALKVHIHFSLFFSKGYMSTVLKNTDSSLFLNLFFFFCTSV